MRRDRNLNPQPGVKTNRTGKQIIAWPCYEPAGGSISLTAEDLVQHLLIVGSTGSGKTTLIQSTIDQLLPQLYGLLILDAKQDGFCEHITDLAIRWGRGKELAVLGPDGTHALDLFGALRSYDDVDMLTQWLMLATDRIDVGGNNPYWQNTTAAMISAALTLLVSRGGKVKFAEAVEFMRSWFVGLESLTTLPKTVAAVVEKAKTKAAKPGACPQLRGALDHVEVWKHLDQRTRSNLQSCLLNVLRPLMSSAATRSFDAGDRPAFHPMQVATESRLCTVSVNALTHPDLAKFILRLTRRQFFDAVQARGCGNHQLCGLIADEFPLIVQPEDADQLATLRSKRCFVIAATQGLAAIEENLGQRLCRSMLLNFNTMVWMRTREVEAGEFAAINLGTREIVLRPQNKKPKEDWEDGDLATLPHFFWPKLKQIIPVCPVGALGRLQPHQGYVLKADGSRTPAPLWFVPWFELPSRAQTAPTALINDTRFNAGYIRQLMVRAGLKPMWSAEMIKATLELDAALHPRALERARDFFLTKACSIPEGLEALPAAWLAGLPGILWSQRKSNWTKLPYTLRQIGCADGVLLLSFVQEQGRHESRLTIWDIIRIKANFCVYPSRWRPLLRNHRWRLNLPDQGASLSAKQDLV